MKAATVKELKQELSYRSSSELVEICVRLAKFKKENKELLTYLLFEASDEAAYLEQVKQELDEEFRSINTRHYYYIKKSTRKILRNLKKYVRYSQKKETEVELLLYFCKKLNSFTPSYKKDRALLGLYERQVAQIRKIIPSLHEDLQYDFLQELEEIL